MFGNEDRYPVWCGGNISMFGDMGCVCYYWFCLVGHQFFRFEG